MSNVYVISDLHLGHVNVSKWRGFDNVDDMNNTIINNWNNTINKKDLVYVLGDIAMNKLYYKLLSCLKGDKIIVLGNHDDRKSVNDLLQYVRAVAGAIKYNGAWLTHFPIHESELRGLVNIHGHTHSVNVNNNRYFNVSCENINYTPILLNDKIKEMRMIIKNNIC